MAKLVAFLLPLFFLTGCIRFFPSSVSKVEPVPTMPVEPIADVVLRYATVLKHEKELNLEDSKIIYDDTLRRIRLDFISQHIGELCDARFLLVEIVEELLKRLNASHEARDLTLKRHFDYFDLEIYIHYQSFFIEYIDPLYIGWVTLVDGVSTFYAGDIFRFTLDVSHGRSEEYYKSRLFATIMKDSDKHYREIHPEPIDEKPDFGKGYESPTDWFSN
jgi:hypothetical protein